MIRLTTITLVLIMMLFISGADVLASDSKVYGPETITIGRWGVHLSFHRFKVEDPGKGILNLVKINQGRGLRVGFLWLNGRFLSLSSFFRGGDKELKRHIRLKARNRMMVFIRGRHRAGITLTVRSTVPVSPPFVHFSVSPDNIRQGESALLSWDTENADNVAIEPGVGSTDLNGSITISPAKTTAYTLTATGLGGTVLSTAVITVVPPPTANLTTEPETIEIGGSATLSWSSNHGDSAVIDQGIGSVPPNGILVVSPTESTTYTFTVTGPGGTNSDSVTVTVIHPVPTVTIKAEPQTLTSEETSTLSWTSNHADTITMDQGIGNVEWEGSINVSPAQTTIYTITAVGPGGTASANVTVSVVEPPMLEFSITPETVLMGQSAMLSWTSSNANTAFIDQGIGNVPVNGTLSVLPTETTNYTITLSGPGGTKRASDTVTVTYPPPTISVRAVPHTVLAGESAILTWSSAYADTVLFGPGLEIVEPSGSVTVSPSETTTYMIWAVGPGGMTSSQAMVTVAQQQPTASLHVDPHSINQGESAILSWSSTHATTVSIDPGVGNVDPNGSTSVSPSETTTYTITATGPGGSSTDNATIEVIAKPTVTIGAEPDTIFSGETSILSWASTNAESAFISPDIGSVAANGSVSVTPEEDFTYTITVTGPGGTATAVQSLSVTTPERSSVKITEPLDGAVVGASVVNVSGTVDLPGARVFINGVEATVNNGTFTLESVLLEPGANKISATASGSGMIKKDNIYVVREYIYQPQPEGSFGNKYEAVVPPDALVKTYDTQRFSVIKGDVQSPEGLPLSNVRISILDHPEYGSAVSDMDGQFSLPVEGGGLLNLVFDREEMLSVQRQVQTYWNDVIVAEPVKMVAKDTVTTPVSLDGNDSTIVTHRSGVMTDAAGSRSLSAVLSGDNRVYTIDENGNEGEEITDFSLRATQIPDPESMPAILPPNSAYTYCVDLEVDGVDRVRFEKPIATWVENFLGFEVGTPIPVGYYDENAGVWVPSENGVVVQLLDTDADGVTDALDMDGDGQPDDLNSFGGIHDEVTGLDNSTLYPPGSTFWRVEVDHFSILDFNFPASAPKDSEPPNPPSDPDPDDKKKNVNPCRENTGSFVEKRSRIFHDDIPIPGTDIALHYASNRVSGYKHKITIPASGSSVPASLKRIVIKAEIAGRTWAWTLDPLPNQSVDLAWDGLDFLGNSVTGPAIAHIEIGFVYDGYYSMPATVDRSFGQPGGESTGIPAQQEIVLWKRNHVPLNRGEGTIAEGWTLTPHHDVSLVDLTTLYKGDGGEIQNYSKIISTVLANQYWMDDLVVDGAGNLFIARSAMDIVSKLDVNGNLITVAGTGNQHFSGDGGPAVQADLYFAHGIALDAAGNLYIADYYNSRVRKVSPDGIITTLAGTGDWSYYGDGGPATEAALNGPTDVEVDASGNVYIADLGNHRIRKVDPDGIITTVAGNGGTGYGEDSGFAVETDVNQAKHIAVDQLGNLYFSTGGYNRIRMVDTEGIITTIAGTGEYGYSGDGGPALEAKLAHPGHITVDAVGNVYISDIDNHRVRMVNTQGLITTMAGNGESGISGDGGPATTARVEAPGGLGIGPSGSLYIVSQNQLRKIGPIDAFDSHLNPGEIPFAEESGVGHIISADGRHLSTIDLISGVELRRFEYDIEGRISALVNRFQDRITIERDASGMPTAIVSPDGVRTDLVIDSENRLTAIQYPDGETYTFDYTPDGLLTTKTEPEGNRFDHVYDEFGRITDATDLEGGHWTFKRLEYPTGEIFTTVNSGEGNTTSFLDLNTTDGGYSSTITGPSGSQSLYTESPDELRATKTLPCGVNLDFNYGMDSEYRFKYAKDIIETAPSGLFRLSTTLSTYEDTDGDGATDSATRHVTVNDKTTLFKNDALSSIKTRTSPEGRRIETLYDPITLLDQSIEVSGLLATTYQYDQRGRLTVIQTGSRQTTFEYNKEGFLASETDPENRTTSYTYDPVGRVTAIQQPDGGILRFDYDGNGNMTVLTNAGEVDHIFGFNNVNKKVSYTTPLSGSYRYSFDKDRHLLETLFPSGRRIYNVYDKTHLVQVQTPEGNIDLTYQCGNNVESISKDAEEIRYAYDGKLITSEILSGSLNGELSYTYNADFNVSEFTYAGDTVSYSYDRDGLLTGSGSYSISRNGDNGLPEGVNNEALILNRSYNGYGEIDSEAFLISDKQLFNWSVSRDGTGRIATKSETIDGVTDEYAYTYDDMGRLRTVTTNGTLVEEYDYDQNGARIYELNVHRGISGRTYTYDEEDRLLVAGDTTYEYNIDGFLLSKTSGMETTTYEYSSQGELLSVNLPDGRIIEYLHDPLGRRIAKKVDGAIVEKYLWQGRTRLLAVYDGNENLIMRFEYADGRMPIEMQKDDATYYLAYDQVGSLRAIADATGNVLKRIDYDTFGKITNDSNPALIVPFGFAGGLQDRDTDLVRFGYRDYNLVVGRWTAKDPIFFAGGSTDLYVYVLNDPINFIDPDGLESQWDLINCYRSLHGAKLKPGRPLTPKEKKMLKNISKDFIKTTYQATAEQIGKVIHPSAGIAIKIFNYIAGASDAHAPTSSENY